MLAYNMYSNLLHVVSMAYHMKTSAQRGMPRACDRLFRQNSAPAHVAFPPSLRISPYNTSIDIQNVSDIGEFL